jgi:hypothetical protein
MRCWVIVYRDRNIFVDFVQNGYKVNKKNWKELSSLLHSCKVVGLLQIMQKEKKIVNSTNMLFATLIVCIGILLDYTALKKYLWVGCFHKKQTIWFVSFKLSGSSTLKKLTMQESVLTYFKSLDSLLAEHLPRASRCRTGKLRQKTFRWKAGISFSPLQKKLGLQK